MSTDSDTIARALPNYEVGPPLGQGGFGVVYAGVQRRLNRPVAIKQLPTALSNDSAVRARFVTEAQVLASLDHPHVVPVYDYVEADGLCLLVMERLPGGTVWDTFRKNGLSHQRACAIAIAAASGLHHAHAHGILHRDVKPENLMFNSAFQLKVTDFGIARVVGGNDTIATSDGGILGTPTYMAPEQAEGRDLGPAADVYSAGVMLYEMLSGRLPFSQDGGGLAIVYRHVYENPLPLNQAAPTLPAPLVDVVMRAITRNPAERYATAEEFAVAVADAAVASFGSDWYAQSGLRVIGTDRVMSTMTRGTALPQSVAPPIEAMRAPAPATEAIGPPAPPTQLAPAPVPAPVQRAELVPIRPPVNASHVVGMIPRGSKPEPLIAIRQLFDVPKPPRQFALATLVLAVLLVIAAWVGLGSASAGKGSLTAPVTIAGHDVSKGGEVDVKLGNPVPITVPASVGATTAKLALDLNGIPIAKSDKATLSPVGAGMIHISSAKFLVAGPVTATLTLYNAAGVSLGTEKFTLGTSGTGFVTIPGVVVILLILFVFAYLESLVRPLWRYGRWSVRTGMGLGLIGLLTGVTATLLAWVLGAYQPSIGTAVVCAVIGAVWAVVLGLTASRGGLRARARRLNKRYSGMLAGRR